MDHKNEDDANPARSRADEESSKKVEHSNDDDVEKSETSSSSKDNEDENDTHASNLSEHSSSHSKESEKVSHSPLSREDKDETHVHDQKPPPPPKVDDFDKDDEAKHSDHRHPQVLGAGMGLNDGVHGIGGGPGDNAANDTATNGTDTDTGPLRIADAPKFTPGPACGDKESCDEW